MELLRLLTLIYAGVLVVALATSLIAIAVYLYRIGNVMGEVQEALEEVRDRTAPLEEPLQQLQETSSAAAEKMERAREQLGSAQDRMDRLAERLGVIRFS